MEGDLRTEDVPPTRREAGGGCCHPSTHLVNFSCASALRKTRKNGSQRMRLSRCAPEPALGLSRLCV